MTPTAQPATAPGRPMQAVDLIYRSHRYRIVEGSRDHSSVRPVGPPTFCDGCFRAIPSGGKAFASRLTTITMHPGCAIKAGFLDHMPACVEDDERQRDEIESAVRGSGR